MLSKEQTPIIPLQLTINPATAGVSPKCVSAKLIPKVSNDPIEPFVETFKSMHPSNAALYTVRLQYVIRFATSSLEVAGFRQSKVSELRGSSKPQPHPHLPAPVSEMISCSSV